MPTALITGITGQDGAYLAKLLLKKGYRVVGGHRTGGKPNLWRLKALQVEDHVELIPLDPQETTDLLRAVNRVPQTRSTTLPR